MKTERHLKQENEAELLQVSSSIYITEDYSELPDISHEALYGCLSRLRMSDVQQAIRYHTLPVGWFPGVIMYAVCSERGLAHAREQGLDVVGKIDSVTFHKAIHEVWGSRLLLRATHLLRDQHATFSAYRRFSTGQLISLILGLIITLGCFFFLPVRILWMMGSFLFALFFMSMISLKLFCLMPPPRQKKNKDPKKPLGDDELPVYAVLVPVFREVSVLKQLLNGLSALNYPADKLDIKIIVEEVDLAMRRALLNYDLPDNFEVIVVPQGLPQTKPRALNYALQFCRGELLTIYDAEDIPDPDQLLLSATKFHESPEDVACLQAHLTFYNSSENWITRQFAAEYAVLFDAILPALAEKTLPLPLGGTSNHFRVSILRRIGGWDPNNVTEDADIGFRLRRFGYRTGVINSRTYEEAVNNIPSWLWQRARWLKGFLHTWLVHMRNPLSTLRSLGLMGFVVFNGMSLGVFISALLHPFLMSSSIAVFFYNLHFGYEASLFSEILAGLNLVVFVTGYVVAVMAEIRAMRHLGVAHSLHSIIYMPVYWVMMSVAAWLALYQFMRTPHSWNKTEHGLSCHQMPTKKILAKAKQ